MIDPNSISSSEYLAIFHNEIFLNSLSENNSPYESNETNSFNNNSRNFNNINPITRNLTSANGPGSSSNGFNNFFQTPNPSTPNYIMGGNNFPQQYLQSNNNSMLGGTNFMNNNRSFRELQS